MDERSPHERRRSEWTRAIATPLGVAALLLVSCTWLRVLASEAPDFDSPPFVGHTTTTTTTISWVTKAPSIGRLRFGGESDALEQVRVDAEPRRIHEFRLDGLAPDTRYWYRVGPAPPGADSGSLRTAPSAGDSFSFVVLGDTRFGREIHRALVRRIDELEPAPRFVFNLGDMVSDGRSASEWKAFFKDVSPLARFMPYYSTLGNHERNAALYFALFSLPANGPYPERSYSFEYGNTHFTVIDAGKQYRGDEGQLDWLARDLEEAGSATFRIVLFHHSGHGTRPERSEDHESVCELLDGYLERGKVSLVFNAHDHNYVRARKNGIDYIVTGGGGAPLHEVGPPTGETVVQKKVHHYTVVTVSPEQLTVAAVDAGGELIDSLVEGAGGS